MKTKLMTLFLAAGAMLGAWADETHDKVQLWEGGPYWATTNVGAEKPEDYGLYFWWGDTVGYKWENEQWVASDGSASGFSFSGANAPTYGNVAAALQSEGWIVLKDGTYIFAPDHDAAQVHWGGDWRMPMEQELQDLVDNCDWTWTKQNGVNGYEVRGKGDYASNSIFLPCSGYGYGTSFYDAGSIGSYWSSVPHSGSSVSWSLYIDFDSEFDSGSHTVRDDSRIYGYSVRPVCSPASSGAKFAASTVGASESDTVKLTVYGGSLTGPSSVKVFLSYQTAAAADLDFANATINGVKVKGGLKFPLTLSWDTGDLSPVTIEIPVKGDKAIEDSEQLTFQIADVVGTDIGETLECTVTIDDPGYAELEEKIKAGMATKAESNTWTKASHEGIPYMTALAYPADGGKATGSGYCPVGKKVTLKAAANKGWKFLGWRQGTAVAKAMAVESGNGFVATTASLVVDRTAKPAKDTKTSTTISNLTESATFYAVFEGDPRVTATPVAFDEKGVVVASEGGKVTGAGRYAPGKKVTLKATANKGYAFSRWEKAGNGEQGTGNGLTQSASYAFEMPDGDVDLYAVFVTVDEDKGSITAGLNGGAISQPTVDEPVALETNVIAGVYLEWPIAAGALSQPTVKVAGLPSGLKFTAKDIMKKGSKTEVEVPANTIYGAPTAASKADGKGVVKPSDVKITVTTAGKSSVTYLVKLTVDPLPDWAVGDFNGECRMENGESEVGTVSLTIAASGKISGKILEGGKTWTLSAANFSRVESVEDVEGSSVFYATVIGKAGKEVVTNEVTVSATEVELPGGSGLCGVAHGNSLPSSLFPLPSSLSWTAYQNLWKRADTKASQPVFKKNIVVEYHFGAVGDKNNTVKITFKKDGAVSFSGKKGGVSISGSAQMVWNGEGWQVTFYASPKPTAKPPFAGRCEMFPVTLETDKQNVVTAVKLGGGEQHDKVQLWEGGPYWATTNVGAEKPEDAGYYFWWGDTVGYKREGGTWDDRHHYYSDVTWVSSAGERMESSPFGESICPTYDKDTSALQSAGYIDATGNLVPEHDAAQAHWGGEWRMPTKQEQIALLDNCDWNETTLNGVNGYEVRGRGDYASNSIFLPASGSGDMSSLNGAVSHGYFLSSVPYSDCSFAYALCFFFPDFLKSTGSRRYVGQSVRPVQSAE